MDRKREGELSAIHLVATTFHCWFSSLSNDERRRNYHIVNHILEILNFPFLKYVDAEVEVEVAEEHRQSRGRDGRRRGRGESGR